MFYFIFINMIYNNNNDDKDREEAFIDWYISYKRKKNLFEFLEVL